MADLQIAQGYDCVVGAVAHDAYRGFGRESFNRLQPDGGLLFDLRGMWAAAELPAGLRRHSI